MTRSCGLPGRLRTVADSYADNARKPRLNRPALDPDDGRTGDLVVPGLMAHGPLAGQLE